MKSLDQIYKFLKPALDQLTIEEKKELFNRSLQESPSQKIPKSSKKDPIPSVAQYKRRLLRTGLFKTGPGKA